MKKHSLYLLLALVSCTSTPEKESSETKEPSSTTLLWESVDGFVHPESVIYQADSNFLFISNIGNDESNESPDGFISKVAMDGKIVTQKWVDSIQSPKGQCIANGKYYVSALDELLEIDLATGEIINTYTAPEVTFLNDVAADEMGNIYVSGMRENAIYRLDTSGSFTQWFQNDSLHHPNGLLAVNNTLYVGGWGQMDDNEPDLDSVGYLITIDLQTKQLSYLTADKPGKLDGIQLFGNNLMISSWKAGKLFDMDVSGKYEVIMNTPTSVGDILYLEEKKLLVLPLNFQHKVQAYSLP